MKNNILTKEIINHIFINVGLSPTSFGKIGLSSKNLLTDRVVNMSYDDLEVAHPVYAGEIIIQDSKIRGLAVDLTLEDCAEFCFVFRMDSYPLHGLRLTYNGDHEYEDSDNGIFRIFNDKNESWIEANIFTQGMALSGIEQIISYGLLWEPCTNIDDLYRAALILSTS